MEGPVRGLLLEGSVRGWCWEDSARMEGRRSQYGCGGWRNLYGRVMGGSGTGVVYEGIAPG